ncbi:MAG: histidine kinase [Eubacterium sp.]|jgi:sensor histidine kinase regulating citrate/malate metabolism|nr:histidine kinase [Eubacterium sp.]
MKQNLDISKTSVTIIVLNTFLIIVVLLVSIYGFSQGQSNKVASESNINILLLIAIIIVAVNSLVVIHDRYSLKRADNRFGVLKSTMDQVETLNNTLRAQRHDFLNQLQVMYSLLEMNEYREAMNYIESVYQDILKVSRFLKTSSPAVNALLQAKLLACGKVGIEVDLKVSSQLNELKIPAWELCRVLGNLIDNSIYALKDINDKKLLQIEIYQDIRFTGFKISNNGPEINNKVMEKIFTPGFTTKGEQGEGMGLSIVNEIVNANEGTVEVMSTQERTCFEVRIPR